MMLRGEARSSLSYLGMSIGWARALAARLKHSPTFKHMTGQFSRNKKHATELCVLHLRLRSPRSSTASAFPSMVPRVLIAHRLKFGELLQYVPMSIHPPLSGL
ncbi:hypothetical protein EDB85DRAFT_2044191 [Lactarius pseudohatsudake]|nr:hypothetical protein EDB85DRAFT_2044191 [Lactarius pseudohatsudake]